MTGTRKLLACIATLALTANVELQAQPAPAAVEAAAGSGQVVFFAPGDTTGPANIGVTIALPGGGLQKGTIPNYFKQTIYSKAPECGAAGSLTVSLNEGWYRWSVPAHRCAGSLVEEGGAMKVQSGVCLKIDLAKLWACGGPVAGGPQ